MKETNKMKVVGTTNTDTLIEVIDIDAEMLVCFASSKDARAYWRKRDERERCVFSWLKFMMVVIAAIILSVHMKMAYSEYMPKEVNAPDGYIKTYYTYTVDYGDTVDSILERVIECPYYNTDGYRLKDLRSEVVKINDLDNQDLILVGEDLKIPYFVKEGFLNPSDEEIQTPPIVEVVFE